MDHFNGTFNVFFFAYFLRLEISSPHSFKLHEKDFFCVPQQKDMGNSYGFRMTLVLVNIHFVMNYSFNDEAVFSLSIQKYIILTKLILTEICTYHFDG